MGVGQIKTGAPSRSDRVAKYNRLVGDIESQPFLEAIRQMKLDFLPQQTLFMHLTLLPYLKSATEAEKAVLGGIMLKNETWDIVSDLVKEDDFHKDEHKLIYKTIQFRSWLGLKCYPV